MGKKIAVIAVIVLIVFAVFAMNMRRSHMMGGAGSSLPLVAVSANGTQIPLSIEVEAVTGKLTENTAAQKVGNMVVMFSMNPYPATMRQPTDFEVTLLDAQGQSIENAEVILDMTMPEMWMPPNQPALESVGEGKYQAVGQFTMRGWWRIEVIVKYDGQTQSVFFDLGL